MAKSFRPWDVDQAWLLLASIPVPTRTSPLGVKGAGEAGAVGAMPAVSNALVDALKRARGVEQSLRRCGVNGKVPALTPERLFSFMSFRAFRNIF
jgi:CO/xanthine dehydrogenase Mo-binding subunit